MGDPVEDYRKDAAEEQEIRDKLNRVRNSHPDFQRLDLGNIYKKHGSEKVDRVRKKMGYLL